MSDREAAATRPSWHAHAIVLSVLCATLFAVYGRTAHFGFAGIDDRGYVLNIRYVREGLTLEGIRWAFSSFSMSNWHPLTWMSYMLDVSLFGLAPGAMHLVNVALHGINSALLYLLAFMLLRSVPASALVAFFFLAHPLHVESVAWIAERKDVLSGLFFLLGIIAYVKHARRPRAGTYAAVTLCHALALMAKPMVISFPLLLLLLDLWPLQRAGDWRHGTLAMARAHLPRLLLEKLPWLLLSAAAAVLTLMAQTRAMAPLEHVPLSYRVMNAALAYATYLRDALVPTRLAVLYPLRPIDFLREFLPSLALLVAISTAALLSWRRWPALLVGWLWFLVSLVPVIGVVQVGSQSHADRYMYLPSIGLLLAAGSFVAQLPATSVRRCFLFVAPLAVFHALMAWVQVGYWTDPFMLFTRVIDVAGENHQAHLSLSAHFLQVRMIEESEKHALRAVALAPDAPQVYSNLAMVRMTRRDFRSAERLLRHVLDLSAGDAETMNNLGIALEAQGRLAEARDMFARALATNPSLPNAAENLARVDAAKAQQESR